MNFQKIFLLLSSVVILYGCYPESVESNSDYDLILTAHDPDFNFNSVSSFTLPDTIVLLHDSTVKQPIQINENKHQEILTAVRSNLTGYGWADSSSKYDGETLVLISAKVGDYSSNNIWNKWSWYNDLKIYDSLNSDINYKWFPSQFPYIKDYTNGTLIITMLNSREIKSNLAPPIIWIGVLNSYITNDSTSNINDPINKVFELSNRLHK